MPSLISRAAERCCRAAAISTFVGILASRAFAYDLPAVNLGNTSFLDGSVPPTGPGFYGIEYLGFYDAGRLADGHGNRLPLPSQHLQIIAPTTQLIFVAPQKVWGIAHPGVTALVPIVPHFEANDGLNGAVLRASQGLGDTVLGGFLAFDPILGSNGPLLAQSVEFDVIAPTGHYNRGDAINPGSDFLSLNPFYAATLWLSPAWTVSGRFHYLWNATNDAPSLNFGPAAKTAQAGQAFHMNLATHYQLNPTWGIGLNGYYLQQITNTAINGIAVPGRRERVFGLGPGLSAKLTNDYSVIVNAYKEFGAQNRPQGTKLVVRLNAHF